MIKHIIIRLLIAVLTISILIHKKLFSDTGGGNNGMGMDMPFFLSLVVLVFLEFI